MAKEVLFESERYVKRQSIKRWLFPVAGILILTGIAIAVVLLLRGRQEVLSGGEDTPYPYTWTVGKNGAVLLELDRSAAPGYVWRQSGVSPAVSVIGEESEEGKDRFTITPEGEGRFMLSFLLRNEGDETERIYELVFLAETGEQNGQLRTAPASVVGKPLQEKLRGGEDAGFPYTIKTDEDGDLAIAVLLPGGSEETAEFNPEGEPAEEDALAVEEREEPQSDWNCASGDEGIALPLGVIYGDDAITGYFRPGSKEGTVTVQMKDAVSGACITAECENAEGSLRVLSHSLSLIEGGSTS